MDDMRLEMGVDPEGVQVIPAAEAAVGRVIALCESKLVEAEGGGLTDADTLWPSEVLDALGDLWTGRGSWRAANPSVDPEGVQVIPGPERIVFVVLESEGVVGHGHLVGVYASRSLAEQATADAGGMGRGAYQIIEEPVIESAEDGG